MSHFVTVVVMPKGTNNKNFPERLEKSLAPFQENNMGDCPREFMEFEDMEEKFFQQYTHESTEKVEMPDGRLLNPWDKEFQPNMLREMSNKAKEKNFPIKIIGAPGKISNKLKKRQVPFRELYATFEQFVKEWHGLEKKDETYGRYGYWSNPKSKWDWWEIGGRWAGYFLLKEGRTGLKGKQYNMTQQYEKSRKADVCNKGDIAWEEMEKEAAEEASERWELVHQAIDPLPVSESWAEVLDRIGKQHLEEARKAYWAQPRIQALNSEKIRNKIGWMAEVERYQVPKEVYVKRAVDGIGVSHAVVKDGKWYERGEMGSFAIVHNEKDRETWESIWKGLIRSLPDKTILVAVDCHT